MFTGIVEELGIVAQLEKEGDNLHITIEADMAKELQVDQSVSHNGVCLTVVKQSESSYTVTAIQETLDKSNFGEFEVGDQVNLERAMILNERLDGHIVQGHVDQTAICKSVDEKDGSWVYSFSYDSSKGNVTVEKGSVCVNGVSLTVVNSVQTGFDVAIIPFTHEHTNFNQIEAGTKVNLEFDIIGKYVARWMQR
jgi:riboflavin synthase